MHSQNLQIQVLVQDLIRSCRSRTKQSALTNMPNQAPTGIRSWRTYPVFKRQSDSPTKRPERHQGDTYRASVSLAIRTRMYLVVAEPAASCLAQLAIATAGKEARHFTYLDPGDIDSRDIYHADLSFINFMREPAEDEHRGD